jgi:ATP-dependent Clp protease protease subunit
MGQKKKEQQPEVSILSLNEIDDMMLDIMKEEKEKEDTSKEGIFWITGPIEKSNIQPVLFALIQRNQKPELCKNPVQLYINSPGGDSTFTFALVDLIQIVRFPVITVAMGEISSAGSMIAAAGTKGKRFIFPNTEVMTHNFLSGLPYDRYGSNNSIMKGWDKLNKKIIDFWMIHSKYKTEEEVKNILIPDGLDAYFTSEEAIEHGIVDHIMK